MKGNYAQAKKELDKVRLECRGTKEALYEYALLYNDWGKPDKARGYLNQIIDHYQYADPELVLLKQAQDMLKVLDGQYN